MKKDDIQSALGDLVDILVEKEIISYSDIENTGYLSKLMGIESSGYRKSIKSLLILNSGKYLLTELELTDCEEMVIFEIIRGIENREIESREEYVDIIIHELFEMELTDSQMQNAIDNLINKKIIVLRKNNKPMKKFQLKESNKGEKLEINEKYFSQFQQKYREKGYRQF
jgi:hypothetical protein